MIGDLLFWSGNLSFGLTALSFVVRDVLWLRMLSVASGLIGLYYDFFVAGGPLWLVIYWISLFIAINMVQIAILIRERRPFRFTEEEAEFQASVFPTLNGVEFRKLLRLGAWRTLEPGSAIARTGQHLPGVMIISHGLVDVVRNAKVEGRLGDGDMIGELAFQTGRPFSADLVATAHTRCLEFEKAALRGLFLRNPLIHLAVQNAFIGRLDAGLLGRLNHLEADAPDPN